MEKYSCRQFHGDVCLNAYYIVASRLSGYDPGIDQKLPITVMSDRLKKNISKERNNTDNKICFLIVIC